MIAYIVYKISKGLQEAIGSPTATDYISSIAAEISQVFNTHFGQGGAGTVAMEKLEIGKRRRPNGINILALMACSLDPRMTGGVGRLNEDKEIIYEKIREAIIKLEHEQPQEQQQQPAPHYEKIQGHQAEDEDI